MSSLRARHAYCSVFGCKNQHKCLFSVPATEEHKRQWLSFIYNDNVPVTVGVSVFVCANHFPSDCFTNEGQFKAGFASKLILVKGSVPTLRNQTTAPDPLNFVNGKPTSEYPNPLLAVQGLNQSKKEKLGNHKKRCISSVEDASSSDEAVESEQHVINDGRAAAFSESRATQTMALTSSNVEKELCHASCQTDPVQIFPEEARLMMLGKDFPPLFVQATDQQGAIHYRNYPSYDPSTQPTPTLVQDTCFGTAYTQAISSNPPTFYQEIRPKLPIPAFCQWIISKPPTFSEEMRSEPPTLSQEIRSEPTTFSQEIRSEPTFSQEIRSEPTTFSQEIRSEPQTFSQEIGSEPTTFSQEIRCEPTIFSQEIRSEPTTFSQEIRSEPQTFSQEIRSEPTTFSQEIRSEPTTFSQEIRSEPTTFDLEIKPEASTFDLEIKPEPQTFDLEIKPEPQTFGQEIKSETPTFGQEITLEKTFGPEIKLEPLTRTISSPILESSTTSPLVETATHNHQFG